MSLHRKVVLTAAAAASLASSAWAYDFGRSATPDEIKLWDIDVRPDGTGLPQGSGTVAHGKQVYQDNCEVCHGTSGEGGIKDRLVGGEGTLVSSTADGKVDQDTLPKIKMPNRDGFIPDQVFKLDNELDASTKRGAGR
jgi:S-disulfanyl-L-cysteine oxidoreductase SoxD